jgi:hypothetical protein
MPPAAAVCQRFEQAFRMVETQRVLFYFSIAWMILQHRSSRLLRAPRAKDRHRMVVRDTEKR